MRFSWTLALAFLVVAPRARAEELVLSATARTYVCEHVDLRATVAATLGRALGSGPEVVRADVAMHRAAHRVRAVVALERDGARSERTLYAANCAAAARAVGLVIALALDPEFAVLSAAPPPPPPPLVAPAPIAAPVPPAPPVVPPSRIVRPTRVAPRRIAVDLLVDGLLDAGTFARANGGVRAGAGAQYGVLLAELEGTYLASVRATSGVPGVDADVTVAYGTARAGVRFRAFAGFALGVAAECDVGAARATGRGARVQNASSAFLPWAAVRGALLVERAIVGPLWVRATGSIGTPVVSPVFEVLDAGRVYQPGGVLVQGALGLVVRLE